MHSNCGKCECSSACGHCWSEAVDWNAPAWKLGYNNILYISHETGGQRNDVSALVADDLRMNSARCVCVCVRERELLPLFLITTNTFIDSQYNLELSTLRYIRFKQSKPKLIALSDVLHSYRQHYLFCPKHGNILISYSIPVLVFGCCTCVPYLFATWRSSTSQRLRSPW